MTFQPGETQRIVQAETCSSGAPDPDEDFSFLLTGAAGTTLFEDQSSAEMWIVS